MDIVDQISILVDQQIAQEDDYPRQDRCPYCGRDWHGLPLTERVVDMYNNGWYDPEYVAAEDDSPIVCQGSWPPRPDEPPLSAAGRVTLADYSPRTLSWRTYQSGAASGWVEWDQLRTMMRRALTVWTSPWTSTQMWLADANLTVSVARWMPSQDASWVIDDEANDICVLPDRFWKPDRFNPPDVKWGPQWWLDPSMIDPQWFGHFTPYRLVNTVAAVCRSMITDQKPTAPVPPRPGYDFHRHNVSFDGLVHRRRGDDRRSGSVMCASQTGSGVRRRQYRHYRHKRIPRTRRETR